MGYFYFVTKEINLIDQLAFSVKVACLAYFYHILLFTKTNKKISALKSLQVELFLQAT